MTTGFKVQTNSDTFGWSYFTNPTDFPKRQPKLLGMSMLLSKWTITIYYLYIRSLLVTPVNRFFINQLTNHPTYDDTPAALNPSRYVVLTTTRLSHGIRIQIHKFRGLHGEDIDPGEPVMYGWIFCCFFWFRRLIGVR